MEGKATGIGRHHTVWTLSYIAVSVCENHYQQHAGRRWRKSCVRKPILVAKNVLDKQSSYQQAIPPYRVLIAG